MNLIKELEANLREPMVMTIEGDLAHNPIDSSESNTNQASMSNIAAVDVHLEGQAIPNPELKRLKNLPELYQLPND